MDWQQFAAAIRQGAATPAPASNNAALAGYFAPSFQAAATERGAKALGNTAEMQADEEEKARRAAAQAAAQRAQDMLDPNKYDKRRKEDGGFAFYDPEGKEIDIDTFARRTGMRRVDILKDSENPIDQQYISDWSTMNDISQAIYSGDKETISTLQKQYPDLFQGGVKPEDMVRRLRDRYPHIYGQGSYERTLSNKGKPLFPFSTQNIISSGGGGGGGGWSPS